MQFLLPSTAQAVSAFLGIPLWGNPAQEITQFASIECFEEGGISYSDSQKDIVANSDKVGVLIVPEKLRGEYVGKAYLKGITLLFSKNPKESFVNLLVSFAAALKKPPSISEKAVIHSSVKIGKNVDVEPGAVIFEKVVLGDYVRIGANSVLQRNVIVGEGTVIESQVTIYENTVLGKNVTVQSGTVLGGSGFGLMPSKEGAFIGIPQVGRLIIEEDVQIGSRCTIDRGALTATRIRKGVKIDSQVHIAHNCDIGENSVLCAQVGIAGSTKLGRNVVLGGQVGIADHVIIEDEVKMGAQSGTSSRLKKGETYMGSPAVPMKQYLRQLREQRRDVRKATEERRKVNREELNM